MTAFSISHARKPYARLLDQPLVHFQSGYCLLCNLVAQLSLDLELRQRLLELLHSCVSDLVEMQVQFPELSQAGQVRQTSVGNPRLSQSQPLERRQVLEVCNALVVHPTTRQVEFF